MHRLTLISILMAAVMVLSLSAASPAAVQSERDKDVLGTFRGNPLKSPAETSTVESEEGLREYRQIIETRCVICHTRDRIDEAVARRLPFESVEEILLKRNVVLTEREKDVLGTFWGTPLKER